MMQYRHITNRYRSTFRDTSCEVGPKRRVHSLPAGNVQKWEWCWRLRRKQLLLQQQPPPIAASNSASRRKKVRLAAEGKPVRTAEVGSSTYPVVLERNHWPKKTEASQSECYCCSNWQSRRVRRNKGGGLHSVPYSIHR